MQRLYEVFGRLKLVGKIRDVFPLIAVIQLTQPIFGFDKGFISPSRVIPTDSRSRRETHSRIKIVIHVHEGHLDIEFIGRKNDAAAEYRGQAILEIRMVRFRSHSEGTYFQSVIIEKLVSQELKVRSQKQIVVIRIGISMSYERPNSRLIEDLARYTTYKRVLAVQAPVGIDNGIDDSDIVIPDPAGKFRRPY